MNRDERAEGVFPAAPSRDAWVQRIASRPDVVLLVVWLWGAGLAAALRMDFIGDGLRHVPGAIAGRIDVGEPRWLGFPAVLAGWIQLLGVAGLPATTPAAIGAFLALDVAAAGLFLALLRLILVEQGFLAPVRAAALAVAAFCGAFLQLATDTAEPMVAACIAVAGLYVAVLARRPEPPWPAPLAVVAGVVLIGLAALLYQGAILALGFLPALVPGRTLFARRTVSGVVLSLAIVAASAVAVLAKADGVPYAEAAERFTRNGDNPLYATWVPTSGALSRAATFVLGPAAGAAQPPEFTGIRATLRAVREGTRTGIAQAVALAVGFAVVWTLMAFAIKRRQWTLALAFGVLMVLPALRPSQYAYNKFYVLLPVFLALAAARAPWRVALAASAGLAIVNVALLASQIGAGRERARERGELYGRAASTDCWMSLTWRPPASHLWPGRVCSLIAFMSGGRGADVDRLVSIQKRELTRCMISCFCEARETWTEDLATVEPAALAQLATHFRAEDLVGEELLWRDAGSRDVAPPRARGDAVRYDSSSRQRICARLTR